MNGLFRLLLVVMCLFLLQPMAGCSLKRSPPSPDNSQLPTGKPYTVRGQTYRPYTSAHGFTEQGIASWYGPGFHGKKTANGETYNQNAMTAAHKLLPFNTSIRVSNLDNGRSIVVRINDRGPFVANRVIDLSRKAAEQIGMIQAGTARVRLEALEGSLPVLTASGDMVGRFFIQIGAFQVLNNANKLMQDAKKARLPGRVIHNGNSSLYNVQIGPYRTFDQAEQVLRQIQGMYPGLFVIAD